MQENGAFTDPVKILATSQITNRAITIKVFEIAIRLFFSTTTLTRPTQVFSIFDYIPRTVYYFSWFSY